MRFTTVEYCFTAMRRVVKRAHQTLSANSIDAELVASPLILTFSPKRLGLTNAGDASRDRSNEQS